MADGIQRIDIGIATFRRPLLLRALLDSLAAASAPLDCVVRVLVVDNDPAESARSVAETFAVGAPLPLTYALEPRPGASHARNQTLALMKGDALVFVDDDEVVEPGWLVALVETARRQGADVVFGPVLSDLPPDTPDWLRRSGLFDRPRMPTGTPRHAGGTGNVLITRAILERTGKRFDPTFALSGAEDTEFFHALHNAGASMVWCDEAVAREAVPPERATLCWLWRRNLANGRLYAQIHLATQSVPQRLGFTAASLLGLAAMGLATPLALLAGRPAAARALMTFARLLGRARACLALRLPKKARP